MIRNWLQTLTCKFICKPIAARLWRDATRWQKKAAWLLMDCPPGTIGFEQACVYSEYAAALADVAASWAELCEQP